LHITWDYLSKPGQKDPKFSQNYLMIVVPTSIPSYDSTLRLIWDPLWIQHMILVRDHQDRLGFL
jgi:hypothetical protein